MKNSLSDIAKLYENPIARKAVLDTTPTIYDMQKGLETGDLSLCYGVLEIVHRVYKSVEPYAHGYLLTLTKQFVHDSKELLQKRADANELQDFVSNAVEGMKKAAAELGISH